MIPDDIAHQLIRLAADAARWRGRVEGAAVGFVVAVVAVIVLLRGLL